MNIPMEAFNSKTVLILAIVIVVIADFIFLINYITIEFSQERFMNPMIRKNKMMNFQKFGQDNWEDM